MAVGKTNGGGCLTMIAVALFTMGVLEYLAPDDDDTPLEAAIPGIFFGVCALLPGASLLYVGRREHAHATFRTQVATLIRMHDRFTVTELAAKIGRNELETLAVITEVMAEHDDIDLVFHRADQTYLHRGRIDEGFEVVEKCPSCGASASNQVVFRGERVLCSFCDVPLV